MQNLFVFWKKNWMHAGCAAVILLIVCAGAAGISSLSARVSVLEETLLMESIHTGAETAKNSGPKFVLKEYEGRIGIYENDSRDPTEILAVYVFTLPETDRSALKIGITVYGTENLQKLIEDFTA